MANMLTYCDGENIIGPEICRDFVEQIVSNPLASQDDDVLPIGESLRQQCQYMEQKPKAITQSC